MQTPKTSHKSCCPGLTFKRRPSFLSRLLPRRQPQTEKPPQQTPYIPTHAAPSFLSSTTPATLQERYNSKQLIRFDDHDGREPMSMRARADAMRAHGRQRGEIRLDLVV